MEKKKGSITVFLALVLVLLFSFILTTLEAARITGAAAYVAMISKLSGDSFLASYYYPLFEEYQLFGVDAGYETTYFSEDKTKEYFLQQITCGLENMEGGLLSFETPNAVLTDYETILSKGGESFLLQVKEQAVLDGVTAIMSELFSLEDLIDAGNVGEIYAKQEEALQKTNMVTQELLQLMQFVDGICMTEQGLSLDNNGRLQVQDAFLKQLVCMEEEEWLLSYKNEEIYKAVKKHLFSPSEIASQIKQLIGQATSTKGEISNCDSIITNCKEQLFILQEELTKELETEKKIELILLQEELEAKKKSVSQKRDLLVEQLDLILMDASEQYDRLKNKFNEIQTLCIRVLEVLDEIEKKQIIAQIGVKQYEQFLISKKEEISAELYDVFEKELEKMKFYLGMEQQGYYVPMMRQSLKKNQLLLQQLSLSEFSDANLRKVQREMEAIEYKIGEYTVDGLWFTYGEIVVAPETGYNVIGAIKEFVTKEILSLIGIEEASLSKRELTGQELPSQILTIQNLTTNLLECMSSMASLFQQKEIQELFFGVIETISEAIAVEAYCNGHFGNYLEQRKGSKLLYEREYLLFGKQKEQENLFYMVLYLTAIRTLFTMVEIIKNPQKMEQLETVAISIAGITGIPLLTSITKYAVLLLWSVEEAIIETGAILQGKKFSSMKGSGGMLTLNEIFTFNSKVVTQKIKLLPKERDGIGYEEYITLFSMLQGIERKLYRAMDLIQENIRYQYRDTFRMRNVLTQTTFQTIVTLCKKYNVGLFPEQAYQIEHQETYSY